MAIFRLQIESITRDGTKSSVGAAAYRAGEKIRDDRTNEVHNHSRRKDVTHSEIVLPGHLADQNMEWARNRASLWNAVESAESRKNARVATEIQVTLPSELPPERRLGIARTFSREVADNYNVAVDLAVHDPRPSGDPRNFHAHLMLTTREVTPEGLGAKTGLNLQASDRQRLGLPNVSQEFTAIRERWATITNEALKSAQIEARVDHRSLAEQGIDREPRPHIPFAAFKIERAGKHSEVAESIRADYAARVQARAEHAAQPVRKTMEDIRREARENWLRMRSAQNAIAPPTAPASAATIAASASAAPASPTAITASPAAVAASVGVATSAAAGPTATGPTATDTATTAIATKDRQLSKPNSATASQAREDDHHP